MKNQIQSTATGAVATVKKGLRQTPQNSSNIKDKPKYYSAPNEKPKNYSNIWDNDEGFNKAMIFVRDAERGYSNHVNDIETNRGITVNTYDSYNKRHNVPKKDIKKITDEETTRIYYDDYWKATGADKIKDKKTQLIYFDSAINHGLGNARRFLRESQGNYDNFVKIRDKFYDSIIHNKPEKKDFINGWKDRMKNIQKYVNENY